LNFWEGNRYICDIYENEDMIFCPFEQMKKKERKKKKETFGILHLKKIVETVKVLIWFIDKI